MKSLKLFLISIFLFLSNLFLFADNWVLGSQAFNFKQKSQKSGANAQISKLLPQLILEQFAANDIRSISKGEELDRTLYSLQTERLSLFLQLSKEYKTRDSLVLTKENPKELKKAVEEEKEKIEEIEKKIDENLNKRREALEPVQAKKSTFPFFIDFDRDEEEKPSNETVSLYKNDNTAIFEPSAQAISDGISSFAYNKEVTSAKINGLLTGDISIYGEYCSVTVNLYVFPGAKDAGSVTEVGSINDLISIAQAVTRQLTPKVANSKPVKLVFEIEPEEAAANPEITIDGVVINPKNSAGVVVDAGIHSITVNSSGFVPQTINYAFTGEELYTIHAKLPAETAGIASIKLKKLMPGVFNFNGVETVNIDEENPAGTVSINGQTILGVFTDSDKQTAFVLIPDKLSQDGKELSVNVKPFDRAKNIDHRRKSMYTAYSVLICSLVPAFYCTGTYNSYANSYNAGRGSYSDAQKWQKYTYVSAGVSITAGVWLAVELVRYLYAANEVLPATVKEN